MIETQQQNTWIFAFRKQDLLMQVGDHGLQVPQGLDLGVCGLDVLRRQPLPALDGSDCIAVELSAATEAPTGMVFSGLRALYGHIAPSHYRMAGRAVQIVEWDRSHQFCGACGARTEDKADEGAKRCAHCGRLYFPRISPAVIVRIRDGNRLLLGRSHGFAPGVYSTLAGFVEPGETLEEAVVREVAEEVGVQITNLRYFGSQPWPFPHSLMVGFTADYAGGAIKLQESEIEDARWFTVDNLPLLPPPLSIARQLIDDFVATAPR